MNLRRGLFRIWIVFAVLWVASIGWVEVPMWRSDFNIWGTHPTSETDAPSRCDSEQNPQLCRTLMQTAATLAKETRQSQPAPFDLIATLFGPPLGLMVVAGIVRWIGRGFRVPRSGNQVPN